MTRTLVVGGGSAALAAALRAAQSGSSVDLLDAAPYEQLGGNSLYARGLVRCAYESLDELAALTGHPVSELVRLRHEPYSRNEYEADLAAASNGAHDHMLAEWWIDGSLGAMTWYQSLGVTFDVTEDRWQFRGRGAAIGVVGGGPALVAALLSACREAQVRIHSRNQVVSLSGDDSSISGVVTTDGREWTADRIIIACGGFQASPEMRMRHLGSEWRHAVVRGCPFNTGILYDELASRGAAHAGQMDHCHAVPVAAGTPSAPGGAATRPLYRHGLLVNSRGERFTEETGAAPELMHEAVSAAIAGQPGGRAFQMFDQAGRQRLDSRYLDLTATVAPDLRSLARALGMRPEALEKTAQGHRTTPGRSPAREGYRSDEKVPRTFEVPPFYAWEVRAGITFTYGGLRIDRDGRVMRTDDQVIQGVYACGDVIGGMTANAFLTGSGLVFGAVTGMIAGGNP